MNYLGRKRKSISPMITMIDQKKLSDYCENTFYMTSRLLFYISRYTTLNESFIENLQLYINEEISKCLDYTTTEQIKQIKPSTKDNMGSLTLLQWYYNFLLAFKKETKLTSNKIIRQYDEYNNAFKYKQATDLSFIDNTQSVVAQMKRELLISIFLYKKMQMNPFIYKCLLCPEDNYSEYDYIINKAEMRSYCLSQTYLDCLSHILSQQNLFCLIDRLKEIVTTAINKGRWFYVELPEEIKAFGLLGNVIIIKDKFEKKILRRKSEVITKACILRSLLYAIGNNVSREVFQEPFPRKFYFEEITNDKEMLNSGECVDNFLFNSMNEINLNYATFILNPDNYIHNYPIFSQLLHEATITPQPEGSTEPELKIHLIGAARNSMLHSSKKYLDMDDLPPKKNP